MSAQGISFRTTAKVVSCLRAHKAPENTVAAEKLRHMAEFATAVEVRAELLGLANGYDRLADDSTVGRIADGLRSVEISEN